LITDGSLILDIALGIIVAKVLISFLKGAGEVLRVFLERVVPSRKAATTGNLEEASAEDWRDLWDSLPESGIEHLKTIVEDEQLRRRVQELNLWPYLWSAAPEETKEQLRTRWKVAKVPPKASI
jgi:hypothetical protein